MSKPTALLRVWGLGLVAVVALVLSACASGQGAGGAGGWSTLAALPAASETPAGATTVEVSLGETDAQHMFIDLSTDTVPAGPVTFVVTNDGTQTHEFVVLATDTPAADFPIASFEGEADRIDEDTAGTNVGETGDMEPGTTMTLTMDLTAGHHAVVCNLPGHYRMGMHQDFTVTPAGATTVEVSLGETDAQHMFIDLSTDTVPAGPVTFVVTNDGTQTHEFVVLATDTPAADFPIASFEGEADRIDEDTAGTNVGETGDMEPGTTMTLTMDLTAGHHAVVCNLPGHYRMGMHQDFTVTPAGATTVEVSLGETDAQHMFIDLSTDTVPAGPVTFVVTNDGTQTHEFVVLATDTPAADFPIASFEGEADRIDEDTAGTNVGETGDMEPGTTMTLTMDLTAGHHAVVCNLPGHYRMGMHQDFTVT